MHGHDPGDCDHVSLYDARQRQIAEATPRVTLPAYISIGGPSDTTPTFPEYESMRAAVGYIEPECDCHECPNERHLDADGHLPGCKWVGRQSDALDVIEGLNDDVEQTTALYVAASSERDHWRVACATADRDAVNVRTALAAVVDAFGLRKSYCSGVAADVLREALALLEGGGK